MFTRAFKFCLAPVSSKRTLLDRHPLHGRNHTLPAHGSRYTTATTALLPRTVARALLPPRGSQGALLKTRPQSHGSRGRLPEDCYRRAAHRVRFSKRDRNRTAPATRPQSHASRAWFPTKLPCPLNERLFRHPPEHSQLGEIPRSSD